MKVHFFNILSSIIAFLLSYSIGYLTGIDSVMDAILYAFIIQWVLFVPAYLFQTEKFFDISGSFTYIFVVSYILCSNYTSSGINYGNILLSSFIIIWAIRLGSFLFFRIKKDGEDKRFRSIKTSPTRFFMTWSLQGMWVSICSACALTGMANGIVLNSLFYLGAFIFVLGFIVEIIADNQKTKFRKDPANKDKFINSGLWSYSRHPNYLGEIILWLGISIISFSSLTGWQLITLTSPLFTYVLLVYISGIRILEARGRKKWGHLDSYQEYIKSTPTLLF